MFSFDVSVYGLHRLETEDDGANGSIMNRRRREKERALQCCLNDGVVRKPKTNSVSFLV